MRHIWVKKNVSKKWIASRILQKTFFSPTAKEEIQWIPDREFTFFSTGRLPPTLSIFLQVRRSWNEDSTTGRVKVEGEKLKSEKIWGRSPFDQIGSRLLETKNVCRKKKNRTIEGVKCEKFDDCVVFTLIYECLYMWYQVLLYTIHNYGVTMCACGKKRSVPAN